MPLFAPVTTAIRFDIFVNSSRSNNDAKAPQLKTTVKFFVGQFLLGNLEFLWKTVELPQIRERSKLFVWPYRVSVLLSPGQCSTATGTKRGKVNLNIL